MSFDIFMQSFRGGEAGTPDADGVRRALAAAGIPYDDSPESHVINTPDGGSAELCAGGLELGGTFTSCMFALRGGPTPDVLRLMFAVAKAGEMVILPAMDPFIPILIRPDQLEHLPDTLRSNEPPPVLCFSGEELGQLIGNGYDAWVAYRDRVRALTTPPALLE